MEFEDDIASGMRAGIAQPVRFAGRKMDDRVRTSPLAQRLELAFEENDHAIVVVDVRRMAGARREKAEMSAEHPEARRRALEQHPRLESGTRAGRLHGRKIDVLETKFVHTTATRPTPLEHQIIRGLRPYGSQRVREVGGKVDELVGRQPPLSPSARTARQDESGLALEHDEQLLVDVGMRRVG